MKWQWNVGTQNEATLEIPTLGAILHPAHTFRMYRSMRHLASLAADGKEIDYARFRDELIQKLAAGEFEYLEVDGRRY